jgi:hypothetical protein
MLQAGRHKKYTQSFGSKNLKEKDHFVDLG